MPGHGHGLVRQASRRSCCPENVSSDAAGRAAGRGRARARPDQLDAPLDQLDALGVDAADDAGEARGVGEHGPHQRGRCRPARCARRDASSSVSRNAGFALVALRLAQPTQRGDPLGRVGLLGVLEQVEHGEEAMLGVGEGPAGERLLGRGQPVAHGAADVAALGPALGAVVRRARRRRAGRSFSITSAMRRCRRRRRVAVSSS